MKKQITYSITLILIGLSNIWVILLDTSSSCFPPSYQPTLFIFILYFLLWLAGLMLYIKNPMYRIILAMAAGGFFVDSCIRVGFYSDEIMPITFGFFILVQMLSAWILIDQPLTIRNLDFEENELK